MAQVHIGEYADIHLAAYPDRVLKGANQQHSADHRSQHSHGQGPPGSGESGPDAARDVRHRDVPRRDAGNARHRAGHRDSAPARPRVGLHAVGKRPLPAPGSGRREHAARTTCRKSSPASSPATRWWRTRWSSRTRWSNRMIRRVVDFALKNRFLVLASRCCCSSGAIVASTQLPVEAYPDVADNYVEIITQWPGISAEQIEQQVTIPLEIVMNGIPHVTHLRSFSLFGLSDLKLIFDDEEENVWNRERVLERLSQVTLAARASSPQMGTDWSPVGQIYFFTLHSTNPAYDVMELKSIEDWVVEKNFKAVPEHRGCRQLRRPHARIPGSRRSQQADRLRAQPRPGGATTHQQQRQCRRQLHRSRPAADQRPGSRPGQERARYRKHRHPDQERHAAPREGYRRRRARPEDPAGPVCAGRFAARTARSSTTTTWFRASCSCARAPTRTRRSQGLHEKVKELNDHILPAGVKIVPLHRPQRLVHFTTHTVLHNLTEGIILVVDRSVPVPGQCARRPHRRPDHSVFAVVRRDLSQPEGHSREPACRWARWISAWWWMARW